MERRSKVVSKELKETVNKLEELKKLHEVARIEEKETLDSVMNTIKEIVNNNDMFCGLIITRKDLIKMVELMLETGDPTIQVEFRLYFKE